MKKRFYPADGNAARNAWFLSHRALKCQSGQAVLGLFDLSGPVSAKIRPVPEPASAVGPLIQRELDHGLAGRNFLARLVGYEDVDQNPARF
jgi:hypothetical protein